MLESDEIPQAARERITNEHPAKTAQRCGAARFECAILIRLNQNSDPKISIVTFYYSNRYGSFFRSSTRVVCREHLRPGLRTGIVEVVRPVLQLLLLMR